MGSLTNDPLNYFDYSPHLEEDLAFLYSRPVHRPTHDAKPSGGRLTPYNDSPVGTSHNGNFHLTPSPSRSDRKATSSDEARRSISGNITKKNKWPRGNSPPLPHTRGERNRSRSPLSPPRSKRRRSRTPPRDYSRRLVDYNELYPSRSRSPVSSSRAFDFYRPGKIYTCDNYGCGGQHSHNDCPLPMRCRGCNSTRHFWVNCSMLCVNCGYVGHNVAYCSDFIVGKDGRSRPWKLSRDYARERQRELHEARKDWDRPPNSPDLRSESSQRHSTQPSNFTRLSSLEPTGAPSKALQRLAFEEEESIKQARHEADMARKAAMQKLELEHETCLLEIRRQYAAGLPSSNATPSSVLYPPYDPNEPLEIPDRVFGSEFLPVHAAAAVDEQRGGDGNGRIKREKGIKCEVID